MKELYNAPKAEVISFVSEQQLAASWHKTGVLSINIDFISEEDQG